MSWLRNKKKISLTITHSYLAAYPLEHQKFEAV